MSGKTSNRVKRVMALNSMTTAAANTHDITSIVLPRGTLLTKGNYNDGQYEWYEFMAEEEFNDFMTEEEFNDFFPGGYVLTAPLVVMVYDDEMELTWFGIVLEEGEYPWITVHGDPALGQLRISPTFEKDFIRKV